MALIRRALIKGFVFGICSLEIMSHITLGLWFCLVIFELQNYVPQDSAFLKIVKSFISNWK